MSENGFARLPLLETDLLRTFVAIAETGSFTRAARTIFRTPSAVSMQMRKLEETLGRALFLREGRAVQLTADGEALLGYGRRMLSLNQEAVARFLEPPLAGVVRFGAPDDFGTRLLPPILARFASTHRDVEVEVSLQPSAVLLDRLDRGELDLTLITDGCGPNAPQRGSVVFSEPLVWAGLREGAAWRCDPLPLALSSAPCAWRATALAALDKEGRRYRVAYSSEHCAGQTAALLADLAVAPFAASLVAPPLRRLGQAENLPPLGTYNMSLVRGSERSAACDAFAEHVLASFEGGSPAETAPLPLRRLARS